MTTRFEMLFSLEVSHDYYGGVCEDVGFVVPRAVDRLMRGLGLVARSAGGTFQVLYRATRAGASARPAAGKTVRIGLVAQTPAFANVTAGFAPGTGALLYRNAAAAGALGRTPERVALGGPTFSWPLARAARPVAVTLKDAAGQALRAETRAAGDDRPVVSFDLSGVEPGALTLEEAYADGVTPTSHYLEPELRRHAVFGVVEIAVAGAFYDRAPRFTVSFKARREILRYYVVARGFASGDLDQLTVQDHGFGDPARPDEVKFNKVLPAQLTPAERSRTKILASDGAQVLVFRSLASVARRQSARKRIHLLRNSEPLIENLPQPGRDRSNADLVVLLSKSNT